MLLAAAAVSGQDSEKYSDQERSHWSFQPRAVPPIPSFDGPEESAWLANPVDAFILQRLTAAGLRPAPPAESAALIRRLSFDLLGLPPEPEEMQSLSRAARLVFPTSPVEWEKGKEGEGGRPDRYERYVDKLLSSPHYGEQWGQHWLDVVRYAESEGFEYDRHRPGAWRYRDYVIGSFNSDKPFDRFLVEQLAGDELPEAGDEARIAAGLHRLGPVRRNAGNSEVAFSRNEVLTEITDAVGFVFLGLTIGCARCHDHMFDPVRQKDYYRLAAFFASVQEHDIQLGDPRTVARWKAENDAVQAEIKRLRELLDDAEGPAREKLAYELKELQQRVPPPLPTISSVANDAARRSEIRVLARGETDKPQEAVGPRVLGVLLPDGAAELSIEMQTPKLELARWLADPEHPLTARVYVNRLWHYHFGQGIVATPNDFGTNGSPPSHPELLDYLANELVRSGWSTKRVQRLIVTSNTYRQAGAATVQRSTFKVPGFGSRPTLNFEPGSLNPAAVDPDNRLLWHFPRRRLTAEEFRDAMLAVSGRLNRALGGESIMPPVPKELTDLLYDPKQWIVTPDKRQHDRRSIYLVAKRNLRLPFLEVFDQPDLQTSCPRRQSSTHAPQALELLNGELANDLAAAFARRLRQEAGDDIARQAELAYWLAAGRPPSDRERKLAVEFLQDQPLKEFALAMFNVNAFVYVE